MFSETALRRLLDEVAEGKRSVNDALTDLRQLPFEIGDGITLDHHRALRQGFGEVVYCEGKTAPQVADIIERLAGRSHQVLGTRASIEQFEAARRRVADLRYHESAKSIWLDREPNRPMFDGVTIVAAGTSDLAVAEEAALTAQIMGHRPRRLYDVGVAGLHRLLHHLPTLQSAHVIVVVAGMEGALPSVVGGLVDAPVVAVPTSVGYGASFGGIAALLGMLNTCASGLSVVNIDNGFGAGYLAATINRMIHRGPRQAAADPPNQSKDLEQADDEPLTRET
jgi:hypothetical protein